MKFSIPSLSQILNTGLTTYYRFPFVLLVAIVGTVAGIWSVSVSSPEMETFPLLIKVLAISALGVSLLFGIDTLCEELSIELPKKYGLRFFGLILLVIYFVLVGDGFENGPGKIWIQYLLFALVTHLFASFAPFIIPGKVDDFWEFNKSLFLRILTSALYTLVLYVGLVVAMLAIDNLLEFNIDGDRYLQLFIFLVGVFNTWFFLAGVPELGSSSGKKSLYPKALKVFVQYVLIPLVTVYISILYLYTIKILLQWELPNGWVSYLVLSFSIVGIFSLLLLYPIRNHENSKWIKIYSKGYYFALIPLVILLLVSIYIRISEYGVTINRYFVATLGVWLAGLVVYYLVGKKKSIKVIPVSLCLIALGVSFGPLGAFSVSERSQLGRFEEILSNNDLLNEESRVKVAVNPINFEDRKELSSIVQYLVEMHGTEMLASYWENPIKIQGASATSIVEEIGLNFVHSWENSENPSVNFRYTIKENWVASVDGYDYYLDSIRFFETSDIAEEQIYNELWEVNYYKWSNILYINKVGTETKIEIPIANFVEDLNKNNPNRVEWSTEVEYPEMVIEAENESLKVLVIITSLNGSDVSGITIESIFMKVFIDIKE